MLTENIQEVERTRKLLKTTRESHRLARAKCIGKGLIIIYFWISFLLFIVGCVLSSSILQFLSIELAIHSVLTSGCLFGCLWAMIETFKMRKLLDKYNSEKKGI